MFVRLFMQLKKNNLTVGSSVFWKSTTLTILLQLLESNWGIYFLDHSRIPTYSFFISFFVDHYLYVIFILYLNNSAVFLGNYNHFFIKQVKFGYITFLLLFNKAAFTIIIRYKNLVRNDMKKHIFLRYFWFQKKFWLVSNSF